MNTIITTQRYVRFGVAAAGLLATALVGWATCWTPPTGDPCAPDMQEATCENACIEKIWYPTHESWCDSRDWLALVVLGYLVAGSYALLLTMSGALPAGSFCRGEPTVGEAKRPDGRTTAADQAAGAGNQDTNASLIPASSARTMQRRAPIRLLLLGILGVTATHLSTLGQVFEVEGSLEGERLFEGAAIESFPTVHFTVTVEKCNWYIQWQHLGENRERHASFDGEYQYLYNRNHDSGRSLGSILAEEVPRFGPNPHMPVIWLAHAQSCYIQERPMHRLMPAYSTGFSRTELPCDVEFLDNVLKLPARIIYWNDGFSYEKDPVKLRPPFEDGFKEAEYQVLQQTNIPGVGILPLKFELKVFQGKRGAQKAEDVEVAMQYRGVVNAVREPSISSFIPQLPGGDLPFDERRFVSRELTYRPAFNYVTNRWLTTEEVHGVPGFAQYRQTLEAITPDMKPWVTVDAASPRPQPSWWMLAIIVGMLLPVLLFAVARRRRWSVDNGKTQNTHH